MNLFILIYLILINYNNGKHLFYQILLKFYYLLDQNYLNIKNIYNGLNNYIGMLKYYHLIKNKEYNFFKNIKKCILEILLCNFIK